MLIWLSSGLLDLFILDIIIYYQYIVLFYPGWAMENPSSMISDIFGVHGVGGIQENL